MSRAMSGKVKALAIAMALGLLVWVVGAATPGQAAPTPAPQPGGTLIFGRASDAVTLDPNDSPDTESTLVSGLIGDSLVRFKPGTLEVQPWLARSWQVLDNGTRWRIKLRDGVRFTDGTPVNAQAVEFTFKRMIDPNHPYNKYGKWNLALAIYEQLRDVKAVDNMTVDFILAEPFAPLLTALASPRGSIVSPTAVQKDPQNFFKAPVGSGPFKVVEWRKDDQIVLDRNPQYWEQVPYLDRVIFRVIPENSARVLALVRGDIQAMIAIDPTSYKVLKRNAFLIVQQSPGLQHSYLAPNLLKKPFDDVRVRRALYHAINRKALVDNFWIGASLARGVMPTAMLGFHEGLKWPEYDPEKAKALLREAGLASGFKTSISTFDRGRSHTPEPAKAAQTIQADLAKVGIQVDINLLEINALLGDVRAARHDMYLAGFNPLIPDAWTIMFTQFDSRRAIIGRANNFSFYRNPEYDALNDQANQAANPRILASIYKKMQEVIYRDVVRVDIADVDNVVAFRNVVQNLKNDPVGSFYMQYVWMKK